MKRKSAQSILEIVAMIMLVAATIFIGGPTIIRGINAHFKIWDDSVQDSYRDPLKQAPPEPVPGGCVCDPPMGGPGLRCGVSPCPPTQRMETILCNPVGCGSSIGITEEYCVDDPTCCDIYYDTPLCGTGGPAPDCPIGDRITQRACGGGVTGYSCRTDSSSSDGNASCIPHCIGSYSANEAAGVSNPNLPVICPGDDTSVSGGPWVQYGGGVGINVTIVGSAVTSCSDPQKCQGYCANCTFPWGAGCIPTFTSPTYTIPPALGVGSNGTTYNDQSFVMCFPSTISNATTSGPGCGPSGNPGSVCTITAW